MNTSKKIDALLYLWYITFFVSMVCCFRSISSISIALLLITGLLKNKMDTGSWINMNVKNSFLLACSFFYLIQATGMLFFFPLHESMKDLQMKTAIIFVPLALCSSNYLDGQIRKKIMKCYIWILAAALLYCLLIAMYKFFFKDAQTDIFFYHALLRPFRQHAIQVSIFLFIGLVYLLEQVKENHYMLSRFIHFLLIIYFTSCILLLSSKLVIIFSAGCFIYYLFLVLRSKLNTRFIIFIFLFLSLAITFVLSTQNKISNRFNEIVSGDVSLIRQQNFDPGIYFNGLQFRLLQGRFVKEILSEHHAWLTGVSNNAQESLDKKYISAHMYIGDGNSADRGYLGYNTHNQFLESLLQSGIIGLLAFILVCFSMIQLAIRRKSRELTITVIILIAYCFNESVFQTQYGITLFTFFPLFLYYGAETHAPLSPKKL